MQRRSGPPVADEAEAARQRLADAPRRHHFSKADRHAVVPDRLGDHQRHAGAMAGVDHGVGVDEARGDRLLDHHRPPRGRGLLGAGAVQRVGRRQHDGGVAMRRERLGERVVGWRLAQLFDQRGPMLAVGIHHRRETHRHLGLQGKYRVGVTQSRPPQADNDDVHVEFLASTARCVPGFASCASANCLARGRV